MREGEEKGVAPFHLAAERSLHGGGGLRHVLLSEGMEGPRGVHDGTHHWHQRVVQINHNQVEGLPQMAGCLACRVAAGRRASSLQPL